jgi:hypothetical protein
MIALLKRLKYEPAAVTAALNLFVGWLVTFGLHLGPTRAAAVVTISTGVLLTISAALTRPFEFGILSAAISTSAVALAAFGLHLKPSGVSAVIAILSLVLAHVLRANVTPVARVRELASSPVPSRY